MRKYSNSFLAMFRAPILVTLIFLYRTEVSGQQTIPSTQQVREPVDTTIRMTHYQTEIWEPQIPMIQPGEKAGFWDAPSDAIILFDGTDINKEWEESARGVLKPAVSWIINNGAMESVQGSGSIQTKRKFTDFQLHIE
jgi:hypothetical protein